jgi:copper transport protein
VYQQNCVSCHGVSGRGDGPAAQSLPGLAGDFTQPHFANHTDGQVYAWIKGGKPGTAMPAFESRLTDEQIWQVITHIRNIYREAQQDAASQ